MRRGRIFLYLFLIIVLLGVGGFVVYQRYLRPSGEPETVVEATAVPDLVSIVVVTQSVEVGEILTEDVLGVISIPRSALIPEMFIDLGSVVNRQAKYDLASGVLLTTGMIVSGAAELPNMGSVASFLIPPGQVAMTLPMNRLSGVAYALRPGDDVIIIASMQFVDLDSDFQTVLPNSSALIYGPLTPVFTGEEGENLITPILSAQVVGGDGTPMGRAEEGTTFEETFFVVPSEPQRSRLATHIIIPRARVLHVGEFPLAEEEEELTGMEIGPTPTPQPTEQQMQSEGEEQQEPPEPEPPDIITLIVTPQEAVNLTYLLNSGVNLTLALRSASDDTVIDTRTVTMQYFLDDYSIPVPVKLPYGFAPRLDEVELPVDKEPTPVPPQ